MPYFPVYVGTEEADAAELFATVAFTLAFLFQVVAIVLQDKVTRTKADFWISTSVPTVGHGDFKNVRKINTAV